ncbi:MAG: glycosyltransferase [Eubacteriales bacterium]|nr:glycosyltransferase [Eubacteriales bacterium]
MRLLQINSVAGIGSTGRIAADIQKTIQSFGYDGLIGYGRGKAPQGINAVHIGKTADNMLHAIKTRIFDKHGFGSKNCTKRFINDIKEYDPDIIQLHNIHGYYINIEVLFDFLKNSGIPVVWTLHDCWSFTGHCAHFEFAGCDRWKTGCHSCPQKQEYPVSLLLDNSKWNYNKKKKIFTSVENMTIVSPSCWLANYISQSYLQKYPTEVIHNGIDLSVFTPRYETLGQKEGLKSKYGCRNKFVILAVANVWTERKGLSFIKEMASDLDSDSIIVMLGVTEKQKMDLPPSILGITRTDRIDELAEIYCMADVYFNPTLEDTFPTTNLEALACGTPVVTFDTGGSKESVDETCGAVVAQGDLQQVRQAIQTIRDNPDRKEACINKSKEFNKDEKYLEYMTLYEKILRAKEV